MITKTPIPFKAALQAARSRGLLPVSEDTGSAELAQIPPKLRARAVFSARTRHVDHLAVIQGLTDRLLDSESLPPEKRVSVPEARQILRASLQRLGYDPADVDARPGSLKDLASTRRLNLILSQNVRAARGFGQVQQGSSEAVLLAFPAQEFIRTQSRDQPRGNWQERWQNAGGRFYGGRMIAVKDDPVWTRLSIFGQPWPPFDYGSGMGVRDVSRREALRLGVIQAGSKAPAPPLQDFNDDVASDRPMPSATLRDRIASVLGPAAEVVNGILRILPVEDLL